MSKEQDLKEELEILEMKTKTAEKEYDELNRQTRRIRIEHYKLKQVDFKND